MASRQEALAAVDAAIVDCAKAAQKAANEGSAGAAEDFASATRQLAEVVAWLNNPAQPHGGNA
jgi:hypothetical protein